MSYSRAVWLEGAKEEEGTVSSNWIVDGKVYWPSGPHGVVNAMKNKRKPDTATWMCFDLVKVKYVSGKSISHLLLL